MWFGCTPRSFAFSRAVAKADGFSSLPFLFLFSLQSALLVPLGAVELFTS